MLVLPVVLGVAIVAVSLLSPDDDVAVPPSASTGPVARASPTSTPGPTRCPGDDADPIAFSPPRISVLGPFILTIPAGDDWCRLDSEPVVWAASRDSWRPGDAIGFSEVGAIPCVDGEPQTPGDGRTPPGPVATGIDGYAAQRYDFRPGSPCHPNEVLDALHAPGGRGAVRLTLWTVDIEGSRVAMWAMTAPPTSRDAMVRAIESVRIDPDPEFPPEQLPDRLTFPPQGVLAAGGLYWASIDSHSTHRCCPDGFGFSFHIRSAGWASSGPAVDDHAGMLSKGTVGAPDGAVIRFGDPDRVYVDPCGHELGPAVGPSPEDLVDVMPRIQGVTLHDPIRVPLRWSTAWQVTLTLPDTLGCDPGEFALWWDRDTGPRFATAASSTIRLWIFNPNDRSIFGRVVVEADTYPGASPELLREVERIVASIDHGG